MKLVEALEHAYDNAVLKYLKAAAEANDEVLAAYVASAQSGAGSQSARIVAVTDGSLVVYDVEANQPDDHIIRREIAGRDVSKVTRRLNYAAPDRAAGTLRDVQGRITFAPGVTIQDEEDLVIEVNDAAYSLDKPAGRELLSNFLKQVEKLLR